MNRAACFLLAGAGLLGGCATRSYNIAADNPEVVVYDANNRGQLVVPVLQKDGTQYVVTAYKVVSEPPPDSVMQTALKAALSVDIAGYGKGNASLELQRTALELAARTERVELLRSALFTLSQATVNLDMSPTEFERSYRDIVGAVLTATLADAGAGAKQGAQQADREVQRLDAEIAALQNNKSADLASAARLADLKRQRDDALAAKDGFRQAALQFDAAASGQSATTPSSESGTVVVEFANEFAGKLVVVSGAPGLARVGDTEDNKTIGEVSPAIRALLDGKVSNQPRDAVGVWWREGDFGGALDEVVLSCDIKGLTNATFTGKTLSVDILVDEGARLLDATEVTIAVINDKGEVVKASGSAVELKLTSSVPFTAEGRAMRNTWSIRAAELTKANLLNKDELVDGTGLRITVKRTGIKQLPIQSAGLAVAEISLK